MDFIQNRYIAVLSLLAVFGSCTIEPSTALNIDSVKSFTNDQIDSALQSSPAFSPLLVNQPLSYLRDLLVVDDSLLVLNELYQSDSNLMVVDLQRPESVPVHLVGIGDGPNSVLGVEGLRVIDDTIQFYDPVGRKLQQIGVAAIKNREQNPLTSSFNSPVLCRNVFTVDEAFLCTPLDIGSVMDSRFARYSSRGTLDSAFGVFPDRLTPSEANSSYDERMTNVVYEAVPTIAPDGNRFALVYKNKDRLEIYSAGGHLLRAMDGPDFFDPELHQSENGSGGLSVRPIQDLTRVGYISLAATQNEIYALYSGQLNVPSDPGPNFRNYATDRLFVFDWEGKLVRSYRLPYRAHALAVSDRGTVFIASDDEDVRIYRSDSPL